MMSPRQYDSGLKTYLNPVYPKSFPDPFVLKFGGEYFGYCTGSAEDGHVFGIVRSRDLINWLDVGGAMAPLQTAPPYYWAPEVFYDNGKFYLYYSTGNETLMELRVAVSERPDGGFVDSGHRLTTEEFAIDAHVFVDDDGSKFLFYATDFLEHSHIGTGTVVDRMVDWFTLEGNPQPVTRAKHDWQVYDPNRKEKGGVRWHTVEGPAVIKRKGLYYEMFSGGNWQNTTYGVSFAVSDQIGNPDEWRQFSDGEKKLPILRTLPEVVGPGHNSIVRGPNNRELFCVYHRWTDAGRVMAIDRMDFAGHRIFLLGATFTEQPAPFGPNSGPSNDVWSKASTNGEWSFEDRSVRCGSDGRSEIEFVCPRESFLCEVTLNCVGELTDNGSVHVRLTAAGDSVNLTFLPISNVMRIEVPEDSTGLTSICKLPDGFNWNASHLLRIEADFRKLKLTLDDVAMPKVRTFLSTPIQSISLSAENQSISVESLEMTGGFEELFDEPYALIENSWELIGGNSARIENGEFLMESIADLQIRKRWPAASVEFAANVRVRDEGNTGEFGLLLEGKGSETLRFSVERSTSLLQINGEPQCPLPADLALTDYHQLRIIKIGDRALCYFDEALVHDFPSSDPVTSCSVFCKATQLAVEMIRITDI